MINTIDLHKPDETVVTFEIELIKEYIPYPDGCMIIASNQKAYVTEDILTISEMCGWSRSHNHSNNRKIYNNGGWYL